MKVKVTKQERLERVDRLIAALKGCSDPDKIALLGQQEHDWLFDNYAASSAGTYISSNYMPCLDRAFPASVGDDLLAHECWQKVNGKLIKRHLVVQTLKPTIEEWNERNLPTKDSTAKRIDDKLPLNPEPIIDRAKELLNSQSWAATAAALIVLTGRRPTEIAWCGEFSLAGEYSLIFKGQLKKGIIESESFEIPTLIEAKIVFDAYLRLRKLQREKTKIFEATDPKVAAAKTYSQINTAIRRYFSELVPAPEDQRGDNNRLSAGNLRTVYGRIAAHLYCPPQKEPILYIAKILGYQFDNCSTESLASSIHYHTYHIPGSEREINPSENVTEITSQPKKVVDLLDEDKALAVPTVEAIEDKALEVLTVEAIEINQENEENNMTTDEIMRGDEIEGAISETELGKRFKVSLPTLGRNRKKGDDHFAEWSLKKDPQNISWSYLGRGTLESLYKDRKVNIYAPANSKIKAKSKSKSKAKVKSVAKSELQPLAKDQPLAKEKVTQQPTAAKISWETNTSIVVKENDLKRLKALASKLKLKGDLTSQFSQLLDFASSQIENKPASQPRSESKPIERSSDRVNDQTSEISTSAEDRRTLVKAIGAIADFSSSLKDTIAPLTTELKRVVDKLDNLSETTTFATIESQSQERDTPDPAEKIEATIEPKSSCVDDTNSSPSTEEDPIAATIEPKNTELDTPDPAAKIEPSIESKSEPLTDTNTAPTGEDLTQDNTKPLSQVSQIEREDLKSTLDALKTVISLKQVAIAKEKKKRSKRDDNAILAWQQDISAIERSISAIESSQ